MNYGDVVLFISGDNKVKFGKYIGHYYDSGYYVPFVELNNDPYNIVKPRDSEIVTKKNLLKQKQELEAELLKNKQLLEEWNRAEIRTEFENKY